MAKMKRCVRRSTRRKGSSKKTITSSAKASTWTSATTLAAENFTRWGQLGGFQFIILFIIIIVIIIIITRHRVQGGRSCALRAEESGKASADSQASTPRMSSPGFSHSCQKMDEVNFFILLFMFQWIIFLSFSSSLGRLATQHSRKIFKRWDNTRSKNWKFCLFQKWRAKC